MRRELIESYYKEYQRELERFLESDPEIKYAGKDNDMAVARYTLAVNRRYKRDGEQEADFIKKYKYST